MTAGRSVFLFCDRAEQAERLCDVMARADFDVRVAADPASVSGGALRLRPAAVLIDNVETTNVEVSLAALQRLYGDGRLTCPAIFIGDSDDFDMRLAAVRGGCSSFLGRPVEAITLIDTLDRLVAPEDEPLRVLVIDDSVSSARHHAAILDAAGMTTRVVTDPKKIVAPVRKFAPELILLDLLMPDCGGQELAAVIRQEEAFDSIPILFLSREHDLGRQLDALLSGGDGFLTKPIKPHHLVRAALGRGLRFRRIDRLIRRDSLTGLFNHSACFQRLEAQLAKGPTAFALLDIDRFKGVNDTHGHGVGDLVIQGLARLLRLGLRKSDIVGRVGGEEYGVILPGVDAAGAKRRLEPLLAEFASQVYRGPEATFSVTFSAGIADSARHPDGASLVGAADAALYRAKRDGRARVALAEGYSPAPV